MQNILLLILLLPTLAVPVVYLVGKKSAKVAAVLVALIAIADIILLSTIIPIILNATEHRYVESYNWIPILGSSFTLFVDGISMSMAIITLILILAVAFFSINYMQEKKGLAEFYALLTLLFIGLVGVFITSNLMLFYFCWELMLVPAYFIIGGWGYKEPYRAAFKFFIFTHAGAVFVLLGIGAIFMVTGNLDMFEAQKLLMMTTQPELVKWILLSLTAGFAVKMAVVPVHMWLPDAHSEAPAPMSALLSGVIIGAGAYAILRVSLGIVFPAVTADFGNLFLHGLAVFGVVSAFFGSLIALVENDIKRIIAYSSIAHMGYVLFGLSLFTAQASKVAITGTVLHLINHAVSKGLLFLSAGAIMKQLEIRDIREMGGLAGQMPITATASTTAALSIAGVPPLACFISEFLIFIGAFQTINNDSFYLLPTALMLIATVLSLGYALRYTSHVFLGPTKFEKVKEVPFFMKLALSILMVLVIVLGIWPTFFINLIMT